MSRHRTSAVLFLLAAALGTGQETTVFQGGTRMVPVEVVVRNKQGFVYGLAKDPFTLEDNGKAQPIAIFNAPAAPGSMPPPEPLPAGTVSNRLTSAGKQPAGVTVILLDRLGTPVGDQPFVLQQLRKMVRERAGQDRLAIYMLDGSLHVEQELSGDQQELESTVDKLKAGQVFFPRGIGRGAGITAARSYVDILLEAMETIAHHLAQVPGRKNLVWISPGFPVRGRDFDFSTQIKAAMRKLSDAEVAVYPLDARGLQASGGLPIEAGPGSARGAASRRALTEPPNLGTLNFFADLTGGRAFYNTNGFAQAMAKAADDAGDVYTLGFYPQPSTQDGEFHKLKVRITSPGVEVLARAGYVAAKAAPDGPHPSFYTLLSSSFEQADIGLVARTERIGDGEVRIFISADAHNLTYLPATDHYEGVVDILVSDGTAAVVTRTVRLTDSEFRDALAKPFGIPLEVTATPRQGVKELRIIVQDRATGASGSVRVPLSR